MPLETRDFLSVELMTVGTWDGLGCPEGGCSFTTETLQGDCSGHRVSVC